MLSKFISKRECKIIEPLLWGYAAGRLSEAESARVHRHLHTCASCQEQREAYGQTAEGVAVLRSQPVPVSLSNWQDVQRRLEAASPAPVPLPPVFSIRKAATGIALAGMACLFVGMVMAWKQGEPAAQEIEGKSLAQEQSEAKPFKTNPFKNYEQYDKHLAAKSSDQDLFGNKFNKKHRQGENGVSVSAAIAHVDMPTLVKNMRSLRKHSRRGHYWAAHRKHHKHVRSAYALARRTEQKSPLVSSRQIASLAPNVSASVPGIGVERTQPEYVLTTIVDSAPQPRDFVMDTMTVEASGGRSNSNSYSACNNFDTADGKEIRGW